MRFHTMLSGAAALAGLSGQPGLANDTMAELKTGGIAFVASPDVRMVSEDLYLSPKAVKVDYLFHNDGKTDIDTVVAFPMPDITGVLEGDMALPDESSDNFLDLKVSQDGVAIPLDLQQRAYSPTGLDVTGDLNAHKIPLMPYGTRTWTALEGLPPEVLADFEAKGLIIDDLYDSGKGMEHHPQPVWTLKSVYYWRTTFLAGKDVRVHHDYVPSLGGTAGISFVYDGETNVDIFQDYQKRYCVDDGFIRLADKLQAAAAKDNGPYYVENWISYILKTGSNWRGPIGRFHLTVDKGEESSFVSFCGQGVVKTGPTTFEMQVENFLPEKDLDVLFLVRAGD
ncbi:DUF4424 domain-containing protein [Rhizobium halophytocola]|uniref:DUF4424 domain-containing protein n=1 Tax=Rhizobium halophytocola TaxID=735519 RepID=A0ABS4DXD9_9HYPH|nr:DUF4424 domain-containing protein [Rhizobium halophytocola]MBP1850357.1 hypothetical protein [Rhizobium halophytocola]